MKNSNLITKKSGFTIIELLVVIVIIGILTAITIVSYIGITGKAVVSTLQSDLTNAKGDILLYQAEKGVYPTNVNDCPTPSSTSNLCFKYSSGNSYYSYDVNNSSNPKTFTLAYKNGSIFYRVTESSTPVTFTPDSNWIPGIAATALAGKHVYKTDLGSTMQYKTTSNAVVSPQGATGLDPNYPSNMSLVSPQTNPGVDFSAYPAQNACKVIDGRLPNVQELIAIYAGRATYGNNFQADHYWSPTESNNINNAYSVYFGDGNMGDGNKGSSLYVRCVSG